MAGQRDENNDQAELPLEDPSKQHLNLPGMSQRGIRMRLLGPDIVQQVEEDGARLAGENATVVALRNAQFRQGICRMIVEVSEPISGMRAVTGDAGKEEEIPHTVQDADVKWRKVSFTDLSNPASEYYLNKIFTAKDLAFLERVYSKWHEINPFELNELLGKATPVRSEG